MYTSNITHKITTHIPTDTRVDQACLPCCLHGTNLLVSGRTGVFHEWKSLVKRLEHADHGYLLVSWNQEYGRRRRRRWNMFLFCGSLILIYTVGSSAKLPSFMRLEPSSIFCRDGGYETSPLIGKFCGSDRPPAIVSHSNRLWVKFHSDSVITYGGFTAHWDGTQTGK